VPPDQTHVLAQVNDLLEEALEDADAEPLPNAGQTGVVGQRLVQRVPDVPAVAKVEAGRLDQLPLGADAFEEHDQLQLEEDDRVDGGPASLGIQLPRPVPDKRQIELGFQMPIEVVGGDQVVERDRDRLVKAAWFSGTEHEQTPQRQATPEQGPA
jgi:hypothetical protein